MDGYHRHLYTGPPQSQPPADPGFYHNLGRPPPPQQQSWGPWYPNQVHYQQSWGPPLPPYGPPQAYPLPNPNPNPNHHFPTPPHPYPYPNQEWTNPNSGQHQGWAHTNEEDWAAKARAWAASKTVEDQHSQSQYPRPIIPEEQGPFRDQHFQPHTPFPTPGYQDYPVKLPPYPGDPTSFNTGTSSTARSSVHQQEVPYSYSSVAGNYNHKAQPYSSTPLPSSTIYEEQNRQLSPPAFGQSGLPGHSFAYGGQGSGLGTDPRDQPLNFVHTHHDPAGDIRGSVSGMPLSSVSSWTPNVATGTHYSPVPPVLPSAAQHDPSVPFPSTVTGNAAPPFASYSAVPSFQPTVPSAASYTVAAGTDFNSITSFPGDSYGVSNVSDRPKKAAVPNWLKEEIIKNASVTRSTTDHPTEETKSIEDEGVDKSLIKGDLADSKSIDSTRSTEEEEDDEDDAEAARTAVINQEIKRVLTEVLLKVTDELFDEIATKVMNEDDPRGEVKRRIGSKDHKTSPSSPAVSTPKAEAKIFVPPKVKKTEDQDGSEKSISGSHRNLLGLVNYGSDEDDDDEDGETRISSISSHQENAGLQLSYSKVPEVVCMAAENGSSSMEPRKSYHGLPKSSPRMDGHDSSKVVPGTVSPGTSVNGETNFDSTCESQVDVADRANASKKSDLLDPDFSLEILAKDNSRNGTAKARSNRSEPPDGRADYAGKCYINETESSMTDVKKDFGYRRGKGMNGLKYRVRDQVEKTREKVKESDSRRTSQADGKEDRKEEKLLRASAEEDADRNTHAKQKEDDRCRRKHASESSRHKRRRSPSDSSRRRNSRDCDSSDEASDDSKWRPSLRKRQSSDSSPSSVRSRGRHVSRSPNSKHSQRRHSPYSSLEATRGHKTRSRSPSRRHR